MEEIHLNLIRKAMWPTAIVGGLLLFMGAIGTTTQTASASPGDVNDICGIAGPTEVLSGESAAYAAVFNGGHNGTDFSAEVDDHDGDGDITHVLKGTNTSDLISTGPTDSVAQLDVYWQDDFTTGLVNLLDDYGYDATSDATVDYVGACGAQGWDNVYVVLIVVECDDIGDYTVSIHRSGEHQEDSSDSASVDVQCYGDVKTATISALPGSVEIIPAFNNVSHSLITCPEGRRRPGLVPWF
jgi:hypothetical protein